MCQNTDLVFTPFCMIHFPIIWVLPARLLRLLLEFLSNLIEWMQESSGQAFTIDLTQERIEFQSKTLGHSVFLQTLWECDKRKENFLQFVFFHSTKSQFIPSEPHVIERQFTPPIPPQFFNTQFLPFNNFEPFIFWLKFSWLIFLPHTIFCSWVA